MTSRARRLDQPRVLYIAYWGVLDGARDQQALLPPVAKLAEHTQMTLMTFEKPMHLARVGALEAMRQTLGNNGVDWVPLRYHKRPTVPATTFDVLAGFVRGTLTRLRFHPDIIHARTIVGGLVGLSLASLPGSRLIYHNEGFYPDEQVDAGLWQDGSTHHRVARSLEQRMFQRADGIIALSHRAKADLERLSPVKRKCTPIEVVPSIVDIKRFSSPIAKPARAKNEVRLIYIGAVGGRYELDKIARFVAVAREQLGHVYLRVLSYVQRRDVEPILSSSALPAESWSLDSIPHSAIPGELALHDAGLFFLARGRSEHACSPTKIGEYWAAGLPVVVSPGVSDTDEIIRRHRVGVIVPEHSDVAYRNAANELKSLLSDPHLPLRCHQAAEHYSLEGGTARQLDLYRKVLARR